MPTGTRSARCSSRAPDGRPLWPGRTTAPAATPRRPTNTASPNSPPRTPTPIRAPTRPPPSWHPTRAYDGSDRLAITSNDQGAPVSGGAQSDGDNAAITVSHVNQSPVGTDDASSAHENTPLTVSAPGVLVNDTDADGDPLSAVLVS